MERISMVLLAMGFVIALQAQDLDKMNEKQRNNTLLRIAKETVMEYGPDFYRDYAPPVIEHEYVSEEVRQHFTEDEQIKYRNRSYYSVKYLYNEEEESFPWDYSALVFIWADTGKVFRISFGTGLGWGDLDAPQTRGTKEKATWVKQPPRKNKIHRVIKE